MRMNNHQQTDTFAERIAILIEGQSANSFAKKCGMSEGSVRQYLAGAIPRMDKVVAMAQTAGVNLEWLATGNGPIRGTARTLAASPVDKGLLAHILDNVLTIYLENARHVRGSEIGATAGDIYNIAAALDLHTEAEIRAAIGYAFEQLRRSLNPE
jgi:transcriptional regulator with XRE-family HTH domain